MTLKNVAWTTFALLAVGYLARLGMSIELITLRPAWFIASSIDSWALLFFFFMLARRAEAT